MTVDAVRVKWHAVGTLDGLGGLKTSRTQWVMPIIWFVALSMALAWLVSLPLWLGEGLRHPHFMWIATIMMWTPTVAALIVSLCQRRIRGFVHEVGLWPVRPVGRFLLGVLLGILIPLALIFQALLVGDLIGVYPADFEHLVAVRILAGDDGVGQFLALQFSFVVLGGFLNALPALGEEIGWRGWLWPRLLRLGAVPAILLSGVIWGVWHSPLLLLGYNYPYSSGPMSLVYMSGMCIVLGAFLGWLRMYSASVWPVAIAHGVFNAAVGFGALFLAFGAFLEPSKMTIMGWSGWLLPVAVIGLMVVFGAFKRKDAAVQAESQDPGGSQARES